MALFSDMDWVIIAAVGVFLLFGNKSTGVMRTVGRYYAKLINMKQELMTELTRAADLPTPSPGQPISLRSAFLSPDVFDAVTSAPASRPTSMTASPAAPYRPAIPSELPWTGATPTPTWSVALPAVCSDVEGIR